MNLCKLHDTAEWLEEGLAPGSTINVEKLYRRVGEINCNTVEIAITRRQALIDKPTYTKGKVWSAWMRQALPNWCYDARERIWRGPRKELETAVTAACQRWRHVRISQGAADQLGLEPGFVQLDGRRVQPDTGGGPS